jgi:hypothetical protein
MVMVSGTITIEGEKKMKIAAYYRPPKQVSDIDNKLFKEEINRLGIKRKKDILICVVKKQIKCIFLPRWEIH